MNGFLNIDKSEGKSSAQAVGAVKRLVKLKCGHMGTLDPMAAGVLPIAVNKATRLFRYMQEKRKSYEAEFIFGFETDTLDITGTEIARKPFEGDIEDIRKRCAELVGDIEQIPPNYSAKSVMGRRGYDLARSGEEFSLPANKVTVYSFECLKQTEKNSYKFKIECGSGTYIRSLARDLGRLLGSYGTMSALRRTKSGIFTLENSVRVEDLKEDWERYLIPADEAVDFPVIVLDKARERRIKNGLSTPSLCEDGLYKIYGCGGFLGIAASENGLLKFTAYLGE